MRFAVPLTLQVLEVIAGYLVPITVAVLGYSIQRSLSAQQNRTASLSKLADKRMEIYDMLKEDLNRVYCFVRDVGSWKEDTPVSIIACKRRLDRIMHTNQAIWSQETFAAFEGYMQAAFLTHQGPGQDARIQTSSAEKRGSIAGWIAQGWDSAVTGQVRADHERSYQALMTSFGRDLLLR